MGHPPPKDDLQDHPRASLPPKMWRDDQDPVAKVARKYEIAMREQREEHKPVPLTKQLGGYLLGGAVGVIPGALYYQFAAKHEKPATQIIAHTAMTIGTIVGLEVAREIMHSQHGSKEKGEAVAALDEARQQARESYAQTATSRIDTTQAAHSGTLQTPKQQLGAV